MGGDSGNTPVKIIRADNNLFYGIATGGSPELPFFPNGSGILFEFDPVSNNFTKKIDFIYDNGSVYNVGQFPLDLIKSSQPNILYGVTPNGVFEYNTSNDTAIAKGRFALLAGVSINAASLIEAEVAPLSIPEVTKPKGILYPNPVTATLSLSGDFEAESISVYNTLGQKILLTKDRSIDVSQLSNGVYFITVTTTGGVWKDRFVKQ